MSKYRAIYDGQGKAYEFQDGELVWVRPDLQGREPETGTAMAPTVRGDIPDFVSPIDGSVVRGRAGMRDHCARHNVVPTAELAGLPPKPAVMPYQLSQHEREATKRTMHQIAEQRGHFRNH